MRCYSRHYYLLMMSLTATLTDRESAHKNTLTFTKENNLSLSGTKCHGMAMNNNGELPDAMEIDADKKVLPSREIVYLGDVFNELANNDGLIKDRVQRGTKAMICIASLIQEANVGIYEVSVWILLYRALFLSTVLFNSQTWSRLTKAKLT